MELHVEVIKACLNCIRDALIIIDDQGAIEYWNPQTEQLFGYSADELHGKALQQLITPQTYRQCLDATHPQFSATTSREAFAKPLEVEALRRDGSLFPAELSLSSIQDQERCYRIIIIRDNSERIATRLRLASQERWQHAFDSLNTKALHQQSRKQLLDSALIQICSAAGAPFHQQGALFMLDRDNHLRLEASHQLSPVQQQRAEAVGRQHRPCEPALTPSVVATAMEGVFGAQDRHYSFPLIDPKQRHLGVLVLAIDGQAQPTAEQVGALQRLANSVTTLIDRQRLYSQNSLLQQIIEQSPIAIAITDAQARFKYVNPQLCQVTGYSRDELLGNTPRLISSGKTPLTLYQDLWATITSGQTWRGQIRNRKKSGELFWESQIIWPVLDDNGIISYVALKEDISQHKMFQTRLKKLATHDALTGLPNELLLRDRIDQAIVKTKRDASRYLLCAIDIKQLRLVNESLGLAVGNALLKEVATRLQTLFRRADTIARLAANTFVLICNTQNNTAIATKIEALCADPFISAASDIPIEVYVSTLELSSPGLDSETLLQQLTTTLHRAKASDCRIPIGYDSRFDSTARAVLSLKHDLSLALSRDQFRLWYQPKVNILTGRVIGAEALIRWQHPERGMVSPLEFIGQAESSGQIIEIGRWVIQEVIRQLGVWRDNDQFYQPVSLNISARQLSDPLLLQTIIDSLAEHRVDPGQIELELTESILVEDSLAVRQILNQCASLGLKIALDDFGTGYSSLAYISKLPIHTVKIDRSFVQGVDTDPHAAVIVKSTLSMCRELGINTIAEGVETEAQGRFMSRHGCQQIQGYLFSKPLPADEFAALAQQGFTAQETSDRDQETLVILDDEQQILNALRRTLHRSHYKLLLTTSPDQALEWLATYEVGVVITDQRMAAISGVEFLRKIKLSHPDTSRMILSGYGDLDTITEAINEGSVFRFLSKPWAEQDLIGNIDAAFDHHKRRSSLLKKAALLDQIHRDGHLNAADYSLDIPLIDAEHAELIEQYNLLADAYFSDSDPSLIIDLYNRFTDSYHQHFTREEATMTAIRYPQIQRHKQEHERLLARLAEQGTRLNNHDDSLNLYQLICFLKECVGTHIQEWDLPIGRYWADRQQRHNLSVE